MSAQPPQVMRKKKHHSESSPIGFDWDIEEVKRQQCIEASDKLLALLRKHHAEQVQ